VTIIHQVARGSASLICTSFPPTNSLHIYRDFVQLPCVTYKRRLVHRKLLTGRKGGKVGKQIGWMGVADSSDEASLDLFLTFDVRKAFPSFHLQFRALFTDTTRSYTVPADGYSFRIVNPQSRSKLDWQMMGNYYVNRPFLAARLGNEFHSEISKIRGVFCRSKTDAGRQLACPHMLLFGQVFLSSYLLNLIAS